MATRQIFRVNPQSLGQPRGIGIDVNYNNDNNIFKSTLSTEDQTKSNIINYVLTNKGERLQDPNFGGDIRKSLFDQNDYISFENVIARLENEIPAYVPNIVLQSIEFKNDPDRNIVNISINYRDNTKSQRVSINIQTNNLSK